MKGDADYITYCQSINDKATMEGWKASKGIRIIAEQADTIARLQANIDGRKIK